MIDPREAEAAIDRFQDAVVDREHCQTAYRRSCQKEFEEAKEALRALLAVPALSAEAELGVKIGNQFFFLYKGESLVYEDPVHDGNIQGLPEGSPMQWRPVGKREFGECAHPINYDDPRRVGTVSLDDSDDWKPLPAPSSLLAVPSPSPLYTDGYYARRIEAGDRPAVPAPPPPSDIREALEALEDTEGRTSSQSIMDAIRILRRALTSSSPGDGKLRERRWITSGTACEVRTTGLRATSTRLRTPPSLYGMRGRESSACARVYVRLTCLPTTISPVYPARP